MTTLADVGAGQKARVSSVSGSDAISLRLLEMGLTPGCEVSFVGKAPLGDPLEYSLRGYRLSLRRVEAERVLVDMT
ncbi:MAG: ferrous iron transport protein A [Planctomycetales bacterium]|nr:ferrous iron transport protein A [Planctomycetales bacterium]MCA9170855.1 ferrous iron transport protein A [Planctomycetales bacterium]